MPRPYVLVKENPNDVPGGGGCACAVRKPTSQKGPFLVFPFSDMEDPMSPHVVICAHCAVDCLNMEPLAGGERVETEPAEDPIATSEDDVKHPDPSADETELEI